mmetsp:Transcript_39909/g.105897  ORF Transcript_39909/g.105897 Transcript_39909/m.105897 type:complete len:228 (-) Transcript_39909:535-1218(-)
MDTQSPCQSLWCIRWSSENQGRPVDLRRDHWVRSLQRKAALTTPIVAVAISAQTCVAFLPPLCAPRILDFPIFVQSILAVTHNDNCVVQVYLTKRSSDHSRHIKLHVWLICLDRGRHWTLGDSCLERCLGFWLDCPVIGQHIPELAHLAGTSVVCIAMGHTSFDNVVESKMQEHADTSLLHNRFSAIQDFCRAQIRELTRGKSDAAFKYASDCEGPATGTRSLVFDC